MAKKAAKKKAGLKKAAPKKKVAATTHKTPVADPCAAGHNWETDVEGVEHCTVCLADRKVIEKPSKKKEKKAKAASEPKLSALDAAAQVLASSTEPLNAKQMVEAMAAKGLWTSPGGKTPHATLYTAVTLLPNLAP